MDSESERIYKRMSLYRLVEANPTWSVHKLAEELAMSERWVRKWLKRFDEAATTDLTLFQSQSRAPNNNWRKTPEVVKDAIVQLRRELSEKYHRRVGGKTIAYYLKKMDKLKEAGHYVPKSPSTITKILNERDYIPKQPKHTHCPLVLPEPMDEWEMDFGEIKLGNGTRFEFFLVVDRGTSRVIYLEGCEGYNAESALAAIARLFLLHGLPKRLRFDRDPRFVTSWTSDSYPAALVRFLRALGVKEVICPPRRPDLKPFVERCVKVLKEEWFDRFSLETIADVYEILEGFSFYHNSERVHQGRACNNEIPDLAFPNLPSLPNIPEKVDPDRWLLHEHGRVYRRRITSNGTIQVDKHTYYIDEKRAKQPVLVHVDAHNRQFVITQDGEMIKQVIMKGTYRQPNQPMDFQMYLGLMQREARTLEQHRWLMWYTTNDIA